MKPYPQVTIKGRIELGKILNHYRTKKKWSLDKLSDVIYESTGRRINKGQLSNLENGSHKPEWDTLAVVCQGGHLPYTASELMEIAAELPVNEPKAKKSLLEAIDTALSADDFIYVIDTLPLRVREKIVNYCKEIAS
jgi:transcriptional regulator with XRE-family HTH domain